MNNPFYKKGSNTVTRDTSAEEIVINYYARVSEQVIFESINETIQDLVSEESRNIGKKIAEMYAIEIEEKVRSAVAKELKSLHLPEK